MHTGFFPEEVTGKGSRYPGALAAEGRLESFGFRHHDAVNDSGLIPAVHTTDRGYRLPDSDSLLKERTVRNRVMHKACRKLIPDMFYKP
jgi:hypothetical protein